MSQSDTKKKLINSAIKIFSAKGYFSTRVSDIVKDAGVAQGTFYLYFKSKEDIFFFIVQEISNQILGIIDKYRKKQLPPKQKIIQFGIEAYKKMFEYREIAKIFFFQLMCVDDKFKNVYIQTNESIKNFYIEVLDPYKEKEVIADIILGLGKRLFEFDFLLEGKTDKEVIEKFEKGINIVLKEEIK